MAFSSPAFADPADRVEATGFLGVEDFAKDNGLGNALAPEQRPQTAPTFGGRLTYIPLKTSGDIHLALGTELELSFTPAWTGYGFDSMRPSYFAPVFGYRYGTDELQEWAPKLQSLSGQTKETHVLMNNCYSDYAQTNAADLIDLLGVG